jgi:hypothetical protein
VSGRSQHIIDHYQRILLGLFKAQADLHERDMRDAGLAPPS